MRNLRVYYLVDSSEKMGNKIKTAEALMRGDYISIRELESSLKTEAYLRVMAYGSWARWTSDSGSQLISEYEFSSIQTGGTSELGAALNLLGSEIEGISKKTFIVIVLIAASNPTDDYELVLKKLDKLENFRHASKFCIRINNGIDEEIACKFTGSKDKIVSLEDNALSDRMIKDAEIFFRNQYYADDASIENLGFSSYSLSTLRGVGISTVGDLRRLDVDEFLQNWKGRSRLRIELREAMRTLNFQSKSDDIDAGKEKCNKLREIRKKIASANGISFVPYECTHTGHCLGTCPVCDAEIKYLDREIQRKVKNGEAIVLDGIASGDIKDARISIPEDRKLDNNEDISTDFGLGGVVNPIDGGIDNGWN